MKQQREGKKAVKFESKQIILEVIRFSSCKQNNKVVVFNYT